MLVLHGNRSENKIALTFDDGPNPYGTRKVLKILDKYNIKSTFFLLGKWVKLYPDIVREINRKGHLIGNHGYSHSAFKRDFIKCADEIHKIISKSPSIIRPHSAANLFSCLPEIMSRKNRVVLGYRSNDWRGLKAREIFNNVVRNTKNGSIIIFHDGSEKFYERKRCNEMIKVLPKVIKTLKRNYKLVRIDQMKF